MKMPGMVFDLESWPMGEVCPCSHLSCLRAAGVSGLTSSPARRVRPESSLSHRRTSGATARAGLVYYCQVSKRPRRLWTVTANAPRLVRVLRTAQRSAMWGNHREIGDRS